MKRFFVFCILAVLLISLLCSCQIIKETVGEGMTEDVFAEYTNAVKESEQKTDNTIPPSETKEETAADTKADETEGQPVEGDWKKAYLDYIESVKNSHYYYALVYIDGDDIPELYVSGDCEATGDGVCSYKNGKVVEQRLNRIGGGRYIEKGGLLINRNGNMGACYTNVYKLTEDGFINTFSAFSGEYAEPSENDDVKLHYEYSVEGVAVGEDEHNAAVEKAFDSEKAVWLEEGSVKYEEIKQQIADF